MHTNYLRLITLGRLALVRAPRNDEPVTKRRRQLAVLAVLALEARPVSRSELIEMFWGDEDELRARHSLSNALSSLRSFLGAGAIATRQTDVSLASDAPLTIDALEFASACAESRHDRAVQLYNGSFLEGFVVADSPSFETWVTRERARLDRLFLQSCESWCGTLARAERWEECATVAARWLDALPPSRAAAMTLLTALAAPATHEALQSALAEYDRIVRRLDREYESPPDPRITALASSFRRQLLASGGAVLESTNGTENATVDGVQASISSIPQATGKLALSAGRRRISARLTVRRTVAAVAAIMIAAAAVAGYHAITARASATDERSRPLVAVTNIANTRGDTSIAWLEEGLKQMIATDLSQADEIDVVAPSQVNDVLARAGLGGNARISSDEATDVARRVNATWSVTGSVSHGGAGYVLGVSVFNTATGKLLRMYTVTGADILSLADAASARVLDAVASGSESPHFADVETSSPVAYRHFIRGMQATAAGKFPENEVELDAAIAIDSGFESAIAERRRVALDHDELGLARRLDSAFERHMNRASNWDRRSDELDRAVHAGEVKRGEALARQLIGRYPKDPRGYLFLSSVLLARGAWTSADSVLNAELALDSLAVEAGHGPCAPCFAYHGLVDSRMESGDFAGAERAARKWVALQPDLPDAWIILGHALAMGGRPREAIAAGRHGASLTLAPEARINIGRWMIMNRDYDAADAYAAKLRESKIASLIQGADDLAAMVARERGELRRSNRFLEHTLAQPLHYEGMHLLHADNLARLGEFAAARDEFERAARRGPTDGSHALSGDAARAFSWPHALEADALAASGDTALLRTIADSLAIVGPRSYYGRDWNLSHHVLGLIAERAGRYQDAEREFQKARWGYAGWTRTVAELAQTQLAQKRPQDAIATLRHAYASAPDAMGRYMPRSELDLRMAIAFGAAGMTDSARVYGNFVRNAWKNADPEVKRLLTGLRIQ